MITIGVIALQDFLSYAQCKIAVEYLIDIIALKNVAYEFWNPTWAQTNKNVAIAVYPQGVPGHIAVRTVILFVKKYLLLPLLIGLGQHITM